MNEYEASLFTAIGCLMISVLELGADANHLKGELRTNQENFFRMGKMEGGSVLGLLANSIEKAQASGP